jgi:hypothetical protein
MRLTGTGSGTKEISDWPICLFCIRPIQQLPALSAIVWQDPHSALSSFFLKVVILCTEIIGTLPKNRKRVLLIYHNVAPVLYSFLLIFEWKACYYPWSLVLYNIVVVLAL